MRAWATALVLLWVSGGAGALEPLAVGNLVARYDAAAGKLGLPTQLHATTEACRRFCPFVATGDLALIVERVETPLADGDLISFSLTFPGDGEIDDFGAALSALFLTLASDLSDAAVGDAVDEIIRAQGTDQPVDLVVGSWGLSGNPAEGGTFVLFGQRADARR
jgi:hypothetical protein